MVLHEGLDKERSYIISHLGIIKFFAIWGILESFIYLLTNGDRYKEIIIHMSVFIIISIIAYMYPDLTDHLK
jgi:hypothetical protein